MIGYSKPIIKGPYKLIIRKCVGNSYGPSYCHRCYREIKAKEIWGYSNTLKQGFCMKCLEVWR